MERKYSGKVCLKRYEEKKSSYLSSLFTCGELIDVADYELLICNMLSVNNN